MRIDKLLWYLRFARSRALAQQMASSGHIRVNGRRVERAHCKVGVGDTLTLPYAGGVRVFEIIDLPERRGPFAEAKRCYRDLDEEGQKPIAAPNQASL